MPGADRVIVIGAGIGGLTTAIALRREGVKAEVFERRAQPGRLLTGGGFMLWHTAILALRRVGLNAILMREAGEAVHLGARFTSFEQDADGVTAHFEDGSSVRGDVLVGADGLRPACAARCGAG